MHGSGFDGVMIAFVIVTSNIPHNISVLNTRACRYTESIPGLANLWTNRADRVGDGEVSNSKSGNFDEHGLPCYLDMQAELGYTKHIGGLNATREMLDLCQIPPEKVMLYVGCGSGGAIIYIPEEYGCQVVGIDLKGNMLTSAQAWADRKGIRDRLTFGTADAQQLPFAANSFDIVICEAVNTFVPDRAMAVSEYIRVVKPGGYIGLNEPVLIQDPTPKDADALAKIVGHAIEPPETWENLLEGDSLTGITIKTYAIDMRAESRSQMGFFSPTEYLRIIGRIIRTFLFNPYSRHMIKDATTVSSTAVIRFLGYGLFVGQKL